MAPAVKSSKRVNFIEDVVKLMKSNSFFSDYVRRDRDTEGQIQKSIFLDLEVNKLPKAIGKAFGLESKKAKEWVGENFAWEQKTTVTVNNFPFMATNHRPDAVLTIPGGRRIAIEIKKGQGGAEIRAGIGQAVVYSTQFDFVIYLFVDTTESRDIQSASGGEKEDQLISSLWEYYNIWFDVV